MKFVAIYCSRHRALIQGLSPPEAALVAPHEPHPPVLTNGTAHTVLDLPAHLLAFSSQPQQSCAFWFLCPEHLQRVQNVAQHERKANGQTVGLALSITN